MENDYNSTLEVSPGGCRVSAKGEGLALRGLFLLLIIPIGIIVIWKRRRR